MKYTLFVLITLMASSFVQADDTKASAKPAAAAKSTVCTNDAKKFCKGIKDPLELIDCLRGREKDLSAACLASVLPCKADEEVLCADATGDKFECILMNDTKVSKACQDYLARKCWPERKAFCGGTASRGKAMFDCLQKNEAKLSGVCKLQLKYILKKTAEKPAKSKK
ncbi:MAG TPA: hypothetical protein VFV50_13760 [Bdellovibrionales bacterium]|nr:hypothetical protein [Bdellovibrionales bacterium]